MKWLQTKQAPTVSKKPIRGKVKLETVDRTFLSNAMMTAYQALMLCCMLTLSLPYLLCVSLADLFHIIPNFIFLFFCRIDTFTLIGCFVPDDNCRHSGNINSFKYSTLVIQILTLSTGWRGCRV